MFDNKKSDSGAEQFIFPRDMQFIPEFSVVDMHLMTSNNDTDNGYGCKLKKISLHSTTLYSYLGPESLHLLPDNFSKASELAVERARDNLFIHNQLESKNVAFFGSVPANSFVSSVPVVEGFYRMVGPNGGELFPGVPCVDIAQVDLIRCLFDFIEFYFNFLNFKILNFKILNFKFLTLTFQVLQLCRGGSKGLRRRRHNALRLRQFRLRPTDVCRGIGSVQVWGSSAL
jgi:hypothetical protein